MKKVINITIAGFVFAVEDDAYEKLDDYLDSIKKHFAKDKDGEEIVKDIELSIAEKFLARKNKDMAVMVKDVEKVIDQMGTLKDFKKIDEEDEEAEEAAVDEEKEKEPVRKLYRDPDDVLIAGVASGIGAYFGVETVIVRVIFFLLIFFWGLAIPLYIILWVLMPVANTTAQKLQMRGERITLKEIEKSVRSGVDKLKKKGFLKNGAEKVKGFLAEFFQGLGRVVAAIFKIFAVVIGTALMLAGVAGIFVLTFVLAWQMAGTAVPYTDILLRDFVEVTDIFYWIFVAGLYVVVLVPLLFVFFVGLSMVRGKSTIGTAGVIILWVLWFVALGFCSAIVFDNVDLIQEKIEEVDQLIEELDEIPHEKENQWKEIFGI